MKVWADFYELVLPFVPGCPKNMASLALKRSAIEFFDRSQVWRKLMDSVAVVATQPVYSYSITTSQEVVKINAATIGGIDTNIELPDTPLTRRQGILDLDRKTFQIYPTPIASGALIVVDAAIKPSVRATGIEDAFFDQYDETIAAGALYRLQITAKKPYFDKDLAGLNKTLFDNAIATAHYRAKKGQGKGPYRTKATFF